MDWKGIIRKNLMALYGSDIPEIWETIKSHTIKSHSSRAGAKPRNEPIIITYPDVVE